MDRGLTTAVQMFASDVGDALAEAAAGTTVDPDALQRDAVIEAFNLSLAVIAADGRHTDDELWALVAAFGPYDLVPPSATPTELRASDLWAGREVHLSEPSPTYQLLVGVDEKRGTTGAATYFDAAMRLVHVVASLDRFPSEAELAAIVQLQRTLRNARPNPAPASVAAGTEAAPATPGPTDVPLDPPEPVDDLLAELDELVGLEQVKEQVRLLTAMLRVQKLRSERGLATVEPTRHLVFSGNPGTGKTTVARLLARIYRSLGIVERGHLTEVDRSGLVAGFVGQTAGKVAEVFDTADGGVLLIDEAYSLIRGGRNDFGREAIDAIVKQVEDRRDSLVVILAGYPAEMAELVSANPGFSSRFPTTIDFPDYTNEELVQILSLLAANAGYELTPAAEHVAQVRFAAQPRGSGFGNGRLARNLFEAAVGHHATRLVDVENPTDHQLSTLEADDIAGADLGQRSSPPGDTG